MRAHTWEDPEICHKWTQSQAKRNGQRKPEEICHIRDSNYHEGATVSLSPSPPPCESIHILFSLLVNNLLISLLSLYGNALLQNQWARALSLATGLVARIQCSPNHSLTSISGWDPKSCFKLLQVKATQDHVNWMHPR